MFRNSFKRQKDLKFSVIPTLTLAKPVRSKTHHSSKYLQAILSNGAYSIINKPTRVTDKSATVIDHIITNDNVHSIAPRVILISLTDHYAIMCKISKFGASQRKQTSLSYYRCKIKFPPKLSLTNYIRS